MFEVDHDGSASESGTEVVNATLTEEVPGMDQRAGEEERKECLIEVA